MPREHWYSAPNWSIHFSGGCEWSDTPGKVAYLCRKALQPIDRNYDAPPCAAVCIYPSMVRCARRFLGERSPVRLASQIAMEAGADFIKTSTGKVQPAATMPVTLVFHAGA